MTQRNDDLTMLHYVEQRFKGIDLNTAAAMKAIDERFHHLEQMFKLSQENTQRAVDKAEEAQRLHNISQNEWRATLNDFRINTVTRAEFERDIRKETKDDWKTYIALLIAVGSLILVWFKP